MNTKSLFIVIVLILNAWGVRSQDNLFSELSNNKNVTTVYVSKALLDMVPDMKMNGTDVKSLANKLDQIEIYTSGNKDAMELMKSGAQKLFKSKTYENLMTIKESSQNVTFYAQKDKDKFKDLIMLVDQSDECVIIRITGLFTTEDVQKIIQKDKDKKD